MKSWMDTNKNSAKYKYLILLILISISLFIGKTYFISLYYVSSSSMLDTLHKGDIIFVSLNSRFNQVEFKRGDIVIFESPTNKEELLIKRIVGLIGDTVAVIEGVVYINGRRENEASGLRHSYEMILPDSLIKIVGLSNQELNSKKCQYPNILFRRLNKNCSIDPGIFPTDKVVQWNKFNYGPLVVKKCYSKQYVQLESNNKPNQYLGYEDDTPSSELFFVMGDNRYESRDSRYFGCIVKSSIKGKLIRCR